MKLPLIEKRRPKEFEDLIGVSDKMVLINNILEDVSTMPNLLLHGPQGTGKTTLAKILLNKLQPIDVLRINGSDTTGVDTVRDKVFNFAISMSSNPDKPKIVWIEEFDYMSLNAFAALRSMIEQYIKNTRYVCTCNYLHKIPEPIQSRFSLLEFKRIDKNDMIRYLQQICIDENIKVELPVLAEIVKKSNGDMRTAINNIQKMTNDGEITTMSLTSIENIGEKVFGLIKSGSWSTIRNEIPQLNPDYNSLLVELEQLIYSSDLTIDKKASATEVIARSIYEMSSSFDMDIAFAACCSRLIKVFNG